MKRKNGSFKFWVGSLLGVSAVLALGGAAVPHPPQQAEEEGGDQPGLRALWFEHGRMSPDGQPSAFHRFNAKKHALAMPSITSPGNPTLFERFGIRKNINGAGNCDWTEIGPAPENDPGLGNVSGRVSALALDPNDTSGNTVYVGTAYGGVWKSTNAMGSAPTFTPLSDPTQTLSVGSLAVDGSVNPSILYVATGEPNESRDSYYGVGIMKFQGGTWTTVTTANGASGSISLFGLTFSRILVDPANPNILLAGAQFSDTKRIFGVTPTYGLYRSTDAGASWNFVSTGITGTNFSGNPCTDIAYDASTKTYYAAFNGVGVYQSTNQGQTWAQTASPFPSGTAPSVNNLDRASLAAANGKVYILIEGINGSLSNPGAGDTGLAVSSNGGGSWSPINSSPSDLFSNGGTADQGDYDQYVAVPPGGGLVIAGVDTWSTAQVNGTSTSWTNLTNWMLRENHADQHAIAFLDATHWIVGNDGGVWSTGTAGPPWNDLNTDIGTIQFYSASPDQTQAGLFLGGAQDNGTSTTGAPLLWTENAIGGDAGHTDTNPAVPGEYFTYFRSATAAIEVSTNSGGSFSTVFSPPTTEGNAFYAPYKVVAGSPASLVLGTTRVWEGLDNGTGWNPISPFLVNNTTDFQNFIQNLGVAASNPNVIYVTTAQWDSTPPVFNVVTTSNDGSSWTSVGAGLPAHPYGDVAVDPTNPALVYVGVQGFGTGHVFQSSNSGGAWTDITGNLPDAPVNSILVDPANPSDVYVATDVGVFVTQNGGALWNQFGTTLPDTAILELQMSRTSPRAIVAATHGRGAWTICPLSAGGATPTPTATPTFTPTPCVPSIASPNLDLKIKRIQCSPNQVVYRVFVQNNSPNPIPLSDLTVKLWAFDTGITNWQLGSYFSGLLFGNGVNGATVNGGFTLKALPFSPACTTDPTHEANWEFDVSPTSTMSIPANGGYFIAGDFGIFPAGFNPNFNPGLSSWFSQAPGGVCGDTGSSNDPTTYFDDPHYALFFQGNLVAERGGTDPNTGTIPCTFICAPGAVPAGTATSTPTISPTPTPCNASPSIVSPNLDLKVRMIQCNTDDQAVFRVFVRNNDPSVQVRLSDLTVKMWTYDTTATGWSLSNYFNGNLFPAGGNPSTEANSPFTLSAQAIPLCDLNPGHFANWELDVTNNSSQLIPNNGGYFIDGDFGIKRSDTGAFVPGISQWYSQIPLGEGSTCSDTAGNNPAGYFDDAHYDLFFRGNLVAERGGTDPNTGLRPCFCGAPMGISVPGGVEGDSLGAASGTPTMIPGRNSPVVAAPNVSTGGEPIRFLVNLEQPAQVRLALFTLTGERIYTASVQGAAGENTLPWNLQNQIGSTVASGLYLYEVTISNGMTSILKTGKVAVLH